VRGTDFDVRLARADAPHVEVGRTLAVDDVPRTQRHLLVAGSGITWSRKRGRDDGVQTWSIDLTAAPFQGLFSPDATAFTERVSKRVVDRLPDDD